MSGSVIAILSRASFGPRLDHMRCSPPENPRHVEVWVFARNQRPQGCNYNHKVERLSSIPEVPNHTCKDSPHYNCLTAMVVLSPSLLRDADNNDSLAMTSNAASQPHPPCQAQQLKLYRLLSPCKLQSVCSLWDAQNMMLRVHSFAKNDLAINRCGSLTRGKYAHEAFCHEDASKRELCDVQCACPHGCVFRLIQAHHHKVAQNKDSSGIVKPGRCHYRYRLGVSIIGGTVIVIISALKLVVL